MDNAQAHDVKTYQGVAFLYFTDKSLEGLG